MAINLQAGDTVYQGVDSDSIRELIVERVGRKFFYVKYGAKYALETMTLVSDYGNKPTCYSTLQELLDIFEGDELRKTFRTVFTEYGPFPYSLDQMRRIKAILDEKA